MESTNNDDNISSRSRRTRFIKDEATLSAFRKRNKKLIIILLSFLTTTLSTVGALYFYLLHNHTYEYESAIRAFCHTTIYYYSSCEREYYNIMKYSKYEDIKNPNQVVYIKNPNQVLYLSLRTASEKVDDAIEMLIADTPQFQNCSIALHAAKGQISQNLETMLSSRLYVEDPQRFEQRDEIWNRTIVARDGLKTCLELPFESSSQIRAKAAQVEMNLNYSEDYLMSYYEALRMFEDEVSNDGQGVIFAKEFAMGTVVLQFLFMFFLILSLFRTW